MPKKLDEIHDALVREGKSEKQAWKIANSTYNKMKRKKKRKTAR